MDQINSSSTPDRGHLKRSNLEFPVVGIGASAGGIAALRTFFEQMPARPGMAFVVVMHLSPRHESSIDKILQQATALPVAQVTEPVPIELDRVYVIPPAFDLSMNDGYLRLQKPTRERGPQVAIDLFFRALAEVHHTHAVGIVLSGAGGDGAVGLARIKEQGGVTMAQLPSEAEYDSMPRSAIDTGSVDIVLPVADMPQRLLEVGSNMAALVAKADLAPAEGVVGQGQRARLAGYPGSAAGAHRPRFQALQAGHRAASHRASHAGQRRQGDAGLRPGPA